jgi:FdrA protein
VLVLDVVLGLGAASDPAGELASTVRAATEQAVPVVVSIVGTRDDPQGLDAQTAVLVDAGAWVYRSNAEAARAAVELVTGGIS